MALTKISTAMTKENTNTDHQRMPSGTTAQRGTGQAGDFRYNSETGEFEGFTDVWGAIGGGLDSAYFTTAPTLTTPSNNSIVVGNYSSFVDPVFTIKIGSAVLQHVDTAGSIQLVPTSTASETVNVEVRESGKLQSIGNTITVNLVGVNARYWRVTGFSASSTGDIILSGWQMYPQTEQGGTKLGAATDVSTNYNYYADGVEDLWAREFSGSANVRTLDIPDLSTFWVMYDLGTGAEVLSMRFSFHTSPYMSGFTVQKSNDNSTWTTLLTAPAADISNFDIPQ